MIPAHRSSFNAAFTQSGYDLLLKSLDARHPGAIDFRVAETPVFIPRPLKEKMLDACEHIVDLIQDPRFKGWTERAIPKELRVPNETDHTDFIAFDFGICEADDGVLEPQLIEMQGFPTLFAYQALLDELMTRQYRLPVGFSSYLNGHDQKSYLSLLRQIIVADHPPEEVILLELFPKEQKTRIDFYCTEDYLGIRMVCLTELILEGRTVYYLRDGIKTPVRRIYNRIIFDELQQQAPDVQKKGRILFTELDVEWCPHPHWFYRISKFTLPFIRHPYVPRTWFLNEIMQVPDDLASYVLKPLFSFAGQGVRIDVTREDLEQVPDPENWILQRKVRYADAIQTPDGPAKAEVRIFYFWPRGADRPIAVNNLARLSKGKMIGVRYNQNKEWVGGSFCLFEP
jgi:hypothetical protein